MPILDVELVTLDGRAPAARVAGELADAASRCLGAAPGTTWVRLRALARSGYAESGGGPPAGVMPVFVRVQMARVPPAAELGPLAASLTAELARVLARPAENVHLVFEPDAAGRIAFGGRLRPG